MEKIPRLILPYFSQDLSKKMVILSGPRQAGKTTLSKSLYPESHEYLSFDRSEDRLMLLKKQWSRSCDLVVFDELHKMRKWKNWLKGVYDTEKIPPRILVTGSARLEMMKKAGDSMAGRFYSYRLHPFTVAELKNIIQPKETIDRIMRHGGFPEPFLSNSDEETGKWQRSYIDSILRQDLIDLFQVKSLTSIQLLIDLLANQIGSPVSYESLARELEVSPTSIKNWIILLESLYIVFRVTPYSKNISRAHKRQPKIYFYDNGSVKNEVGARFENMIACALLARQHYLEDTQGKRFVLHYLRNREKKEVDFITIMNGKPEMIVEAKVSDTDVSHFRAFIGYLPNDIHCYQVVKDLPRELQIGPVKIVSATKWLAELT